MHRKLVKCMGAALAVVLLTTGCTFLDSSGNTNNGEAVTEAGSDSAGGSTGKQKSENDNQTNKETSKETNKEMNKGTNKETNKETNNETNKEQDKETNKEQGKTGEELGDDTKADQATVQNERETSNSQETKAQGPVVAVDAGHQGPGQDMSQTEANGPGSEVMKARLATGTTGSVSGLDEYELNLDVSLKLQTELEKRGYQVVMTRTTHEVDLGNIDRATIANEAGADILVRIHANGSEDSSVAGALTMAPTQSNPYVGSISEECMRLSQCLIDRYCEATGLINRGILAEDEMTGINWSQIPVTILEMGFMTNPGDDAYMADSGNQDVMVQGIANGIDNYFGR